MAFGVSPSADPMLESAESISNVAVKDAIDKFTDSPTDKNRINFYRSLNQDRYLLLAVREEPFPGTSGKIVLDNTFKVSMLSVVPPEGGLALLAFTNRTELLARNSSANYIGMRTKQVLEKIVADGYAGLIINPAGPWSGVPQKEIQKILSGFYK